MQRQTSYDWIRDGDGKPKRNVNSTYTMVEKAGACFVVTPETIYRVRQLLDELESNWLDEIEQIKSKTYD